MKTLGLVGGISWVSTIDYYRYINEGINNKKGGLNFAECIIYSLNFNDIHTVQWDSSYPLLLGACESLKSSGAQGIVLCANTAHLFAKQLQDKIKLPIIHIVTATVLALKQQGLKKVGLLGTKFTMEMDFFKQGLLQQGIEALVPQQQNRDFIQKTLRDELGRGVFNADTKEAYLKIINNLIKNGAQGIVLACTEIPMFIKQCDISVPLIDTTKQHSLAAVEFALET